MADVARHRAQPSWAARTVAGWARKEHGASLEPWRHIWTMDHGWCRLRYATTHAQTAFDAVEVAAEVNEAAAPAPKLRAASCYQCWVVSRAGKEREGAGWCLMNGQPTSLSASLVPACLLGPVCPPASAFFFLFVFLRRANLVGGAKFSITSAGTSRPARYRLLAPIQGGVGAGVLSLAGSITIIPRSHTSQLWMPSFMLCNLHGPWEPGYTSHGAHLCKSQSRPCLSAKDCG